MSTAFHGPLDGYRVFVAEDEGLLLLDITHLLMMAGADVIGSSSIRGALFLAVPEAFDCAVLDVHFPDGDIDPVARLMQRGGKRLIFITGHETSRLRRKWPLAKVIAKPFSERVLLRAVSACKQGRMSNRKAVEGGSVTEVTVG